MALRTATAKSSAGHWAKEGDKLFDSGKFNDALYCYIEALKLRPEDPVLLCSKGATLHILGRRDEALTYVELALQRDPNKVEALLNKAVILDSEDRHKEALECVEKALAAHPKGRKALLMKKLITRNFLNTKGNALLGHGRPDEALVFFSQALDLDPKNENILKNQEDAFRRLLTKKRKKEAELSDPRMRIAE